MKNQPVATKLSQKKVPVILRMAKRAAKSPMVKKVATSKKVAKSLTVKRSQKKAAKLPMAKSLAMTSLTANSQIPARNLAMASAKKVAAMSLRLKTTTNFLSTKKVFQKM
jgi:hypothetical protein